MIPNTILGLLLIEVASTFNVEIGIAAQLNTISSTMAMIFAVAMVFITIRIQTKTLLSVGLALMILSSLGCIFSTSIRLMMISYTMSGISMVLISPMCLTAIGEHLRLEERSRAISWLLAGAALSRVIGAPIINTLSDIGGWRTGFIGYGIPITILSLLLVRISIPSTEVQTKRTSESVFSGFKAIFSNSSALACMLGNALVVASFQAILYFSSSFYRQEFQTSKSLASLLIVGSALAFTVGTQVGGRLVNRYGRKLSTAIPAFVGGLLILSFMSVPSLILSIMIRFVGSFVIAISIIGSRSLTLEQVSSYRGAMMSLNSASQNLGTMVGSAFGGFMLLRYSFSYLGLGLGLLGVLSGVIYWMFTTDPTKAVS
jgi:predicted MFS family arabinose efflux permease